MEKKEIKTNSNYELADTSSNSKKSCICNFGAESTHIRACRYKIVLVKFLWGMTAKSYESKSYFVNVNIVMGTLWPR